MTTVSIKEARAKISILIDKAGHGEEIIITRRGKNVARILGIRGTRPKLPPLDQFRQSIKISGIPMSRVVSDNRSDGRY